MATLVREADSPSQSALTPLSDNIPAPFPAHLLPRTTPQKSDSCEAETLRQRSVDTESQTPSIYNPELSTLTNHVEAHNAEILASLHQVQQSCLLALNSLLSYLSPQWQQVVPVRRHSMPERAISATSTGTLASAAPTILTLLSNIHSLNGDEEILPVHSSESELVAGLVTAVSSLVASGALPHDDAQLAMTLASFLQNADNMFQLSPRASYPSLLSSGFSSSDIYGNLSETVMTLQSRRIGESSASGSQSPIATVQNALVWSGIDDALDSVLSMCQHRTDNPGNLHDISDHLPQYETEPPSYASWSTSEDSKPQPSLDGQFTSSRHPRQSIYSQSSEKMRLELETITMAIDRLYMVAPQLHDQRVELQPEKRKQMELARILGGVEKLSDRLDHQRARPRSGASGDKGKRRQSELNDLENIMNLIGNSQRPGMDNQRINIADMNALVTKAGVRDAKKREALAEQLIEHSSSGRLRSQEATFTPASLRNKTLNATALLTLPEFIRDSKAPHPHVIMRPRPTLAEFLRETPPPHSSPPLDVPKVKRKRSFITRERSNSAPPRSWFGRTESKFSAAPLSSAEIQVSYVAEHQENLGNVQVFLSVGDRPIQQSFEAEILPTGTDAQPSSRLVLKAGTTTSALLTLPVQAPPGRQDVKQVGDHLEIKFSTSAIPASSLPPSSLLDASHLALLNPTSFTCSSCSLPLVQRARLGSLSYTDLPSDHWAELVEAWMCHSDQKLSGSVTQHGNSGSWPTPGKALVGGSYLLFDEQDIVAGNLVGECDHQGHNEDWRRQRCICGALVGRSQIPKCSTATTFRFAKYALRPVTPLSEAPRLPLSVFIVADMLELSQAHATYRFFIKDEEEEKTRMLIWLFNPSIRLSYASTTQFVLPKTNSVQAAKIMFKLIGPTHSSEGAGTAVDFAQAESLYYPLSICHSLAALLKESNSAYPPARRTMHGLDIGWLQRA